MPGDSSPGPRLVRIGALAGIFGPILFTLAWLLAGATFGGYSVRREYISALAAKDADHPWIMIPAIVLFGASLVLFGLALHRGMGRGSIFGPLLLASAGIILMVAGVARNDCSSGLPECDAYHAAGNSSTSDSIHETTGILAILLLVPAPFVLSRRLGRTEDWMDLRRPSLYAGALLIVLVIEDVAEISPSWAGVAQRLFFVVSCSWIVALAWRLRAVSRGRPGVDGATANAP